MKISLARINYWLRRQSHIPVLLVSAVAILLLFMNDETSIARTRQYDAQIDSLRTAIAKALDSARYYRTAREALRTSAPELERAARENYRMQRPTEDVYVLE